MRLLILLVVLAAVLGGGGFVAWTFYRAPLQGVVENLLKAKEPPSLQLLLEPVTVPLFKDGQPDRFLILEMVLVVAGPEGLQTATRLRPRIVDAFVLYLHALAQLSIEPGLTDLDFVKQRLLIVCERVTGPGVVRDILFKNAFERPLQ
ncbi:MAG: flagellar basal body-associated FliL family protein [Proteobacteria bacterium]|nr:flagellar basal body-associated FliL family protein [Pseudomonadota bacterium]MBI3496028.1 flagellar basal body-associated FliL family protein [Pseudomonadota bacterium]